MSIPYVSIPKRIDPGQPGPWWIPFGQNATVCCPNGHIARLDHEIFKDGTVSPSIVCPWPDNKCGWHVMGKLEDWAPEIDED